MKTTINIDDALYQAARLKASQEGRPLADLIDDALREFLHEPAHYELKWHTVGGELMPGANPDDRASLYDVMGDGL